MSLKCLLLHLACYPDISLRDRHRTVLQELLYQDDIEVIVLVYLSCKELSETVSTYVVVSKILCHCFEVLLYCSLPFF